MSYRDDILWAADMIERHPEAFDYLSTAVPDTHTPSCDSPGCALGWIAAHQDNRRVGRCFASAYDEDGIYHGPRDPLGLESKTFYKRMDAITSKWEDSAVRCAAALRIYADRYHPADDAIPAGVRLIFAPEETQCTPDCD